MANRYSTTFTDDKLVIIINPKSTFTVAVLALAYALSCFLAVYVFLLLLQNPGGYSAVRILVGITGIACFIGIFFFAGRSILIRYLHQEVITVDQKLLSVSDKYFFTQAPRYFELDLVKDIVAGEVVTDLQYENPLYIPGAMINQTLVKDAVKDGMILLKYYNKEVRFGKKIPSWDAEQIIYTIGKHTGKQFTLSPDFEPEE